jgi:1,5-anhydro-D-fructose reductase (1,5-anhydro-D-mannitol-forming)
MVENGENEMNWALIGASTIAGQYMIDAIRAQGESQIGWVVSGNAEHAFAFAKKHDIAMASTELGAALADNAVNAVYISSTNEKHFEQAMAAMSAGKHVLCEKPLSTSTAEAGKMILAARNSGVVLGVNHHLRCAGSHRAIHDMISGGRIGRVLSVRVFHAVHLPEHLRGWRLDNPDAGGGVIPDLTVHNADTVRFLLGEDPQSVTAEMAATGMGKGVEDSAMSIWTMPSGVMVFSHDSFNHPHAASGVEVHGTEGSILAQGIMAQDPLGRIELVNADGRSEVPFDKAGIYETAVREFETAVARGAKPAATGTDGLKSLLVAEAVRKAAETGRRQTVNYGVAV